MTTPLYFDPREPGSAALPAAVALACTLAPEAAAPSWHPQRAERVCAALFDVLTASQQERVLRALGWRPVLPPAPTGHLSAHEDAVSTGNEDAEAFSRLLAALFNVAMYGDRSGVGFAMHNQLREVLHAHGVGTKP